MSVGFTFWGREFTGAPCRGSRIAVLAGLGARVLVRNPVGVGVVGFRV